MDISWLRNSLRKGAEAVLMSRSTSSSLYPAVAQAQTMFERFCAVLNSARRLMDSRVKIRKRFASLQPNFAKAQHVLLTSYAVVSGRS